jgi:hypothetical protein
VNIGNIALLRLVEQLVRHPAQCPRVGSGARRCATGGHVGLRGPASHRAWMKISESTGRQPVAPFDVHRLAL